jgi:hypothetical protein
MAAFFGLEALAVTGVSAVTLLSVCLPATAAAAFLVDSFFLAVVFFAGKDSVVVFFADTGNNPPSIKFADLRLETA